MHAFKYSILLDLSLTLGRKGNRYNEKAKGNCMMECENPVAMQWDLADGYDEEQKQYIGM